MIRKKKLYSKPRKMYQIQRIKEENALLKKYALKNKKEIWKTQAKVDYYRHRAKELARAPPEKQEILFSKLNNLGLKVSTIADVLDLNVEDLLKRRLQTIVYLKKLAHTPKQARQMIVHKKILIDGKIVNIPGYLVKVDEENKISLKENLKTKNKKNSINDKIEGEQ